MPFLLVQSFVNTLDVEKGVDLLDGVNKAKAWIIDAGMLSASANLSPADLEQAKSMRECIRELLIGAEPKPSVTPLRELAGSRSARLTIGRDGQVGLEHRGRQEVADGLFRLLLIMRGAQEDGTWSRLRVCANPECR